MIWEVKYWLHLSHLIAVLELFKSISNLLLFIETSCFSLLFLLFQSIKFFHYVWVNEISNIVTEPDLRYSIIFLFGVFQVPPFCCYINKLKLFFIILLNNSGHLLFIHIGMIVKMFPRYRVTTTTAFLYKEFMLSDFDIPQKSCHQPIISIYFISTEIRLWII